MQCQPGSSDAQARGSRLAALTLIAFTPLFLTGCFEEEASRPGTGGAPSQSQTAERVDRALKSDRLAAVSRRRYTESKPHVPQGEAGSGRETVPLAKFFQALINLKSGIRQEPVTVLHLGDSHIAADRFTGTLRELFQARFGDAGRGMMMPGFPFPYYQARGVEFSRSGTWTAANSFKKDAGPYGVSGVRLTAREKGARLTLSAKEGAFEQAEVTFATGPEGGKVTVRFGGETRSVSTRAQGNGIKRVAIASKGRTLEVASNGKAPVSVLSWSVAQNRPGIRYVNFGIPGATADTPRRWNEALVDADLARLKPDLMVFGYGTNEGFDDDLDIAAYEHRVAELVGRFKARAPQASVLILAPPDGLRFPRYARGKDKKTAASAPCKALSDDERKRYADLQGDKSRQLGRWHPPPRLADVRAALRRVALKSGAHFWDWSQVMGGACGIHAWAKAKPPLAASDRVHLRGRGAERSARALFDELMQAYEVHARLASR